MSARSFNIFGGVLLAHLVLLNIIWVGFSAPFPRPPVTFIYEGTLPAQDTEGGAEDSWPKNNTPVVLTINHAHVSYDNHWTELRGPSKPYAHLGF